MDFAIQVSNPSIMQPSKLDHRDLSAALQEVFAGNTEDAYMLWRFVPVRMSYKYDLSVMIDDLLPLLTILVHSVVGSRRVYWGSNTFRADWQMHWTDGRMKITTRWDSVAGNYEDLLNSRSALEIKQDIFLREWKLPLKKVIEAVEFAGIRIANTEELHMLYALEKSIPGGGQLYDSGG